MDNILMYIQALLPLIIINMILIIVSIIDILKSSSYKRGNRIFWICIVVFVQIIGPISYFLFGRDS